MSFSIETSVLIDFRVHFGEHLKTSGASRISVAHSQCMCHTFCITAMVGAVIGALIFGSLSLFSTAISPCDLPTAGRSFDILRYCRALDSRHFDCDSSAFASTITELWPAVRSAIYTYPAVFFDYDDRPMYDCCFSSFIGCSFGLE